MVLIFWKDGQVVTTQSFCRGHTSIDVSLVAKLCKMCIRDRGGQTYDGNEEAGTTWVDEAPLPPVSVSLSPVRCV